MVSGFPNACRIVWAALHISSRDATSQAMAMTSEKDAAVLGTLPNAATFAPSRAKSSAQAFPIPLEAPVTTAIRSVSLTGCVIPQYLQLTKALSIEWNCRVSYSSAADDASGQEAMLESRN